MDQVGALPVENALEMILMFSQEGIITYANAAAKEELEYGDESVSYTHLDVYKRQRQKRPPEMVFFSIGQNRMAERSFCS